jgi:hypothetical protein
MSLEIPVEFAVVFARLAKLKPQERKRDLRIYLGYRYRYKYFSPMDEERIEHLRDVLVRSRFCLSAPDELMIPSSFNARLCSMEQSLRNVSG